MRRKIATLLGVWLLTVTSPSLALTFKIATISPEGTSWMEAMKQAAQEIFERSSGRVAFRFYPGGIMGNDASVLRKIRVGQLSGGAITGGGLAKIYPNAQVYSLPLAFRSFDEVDYVRSRMDPVLLDGILQQGFVSFGLSEGGFAYVMSNQPLHSVQDMKGQKVWVPEGDLLSRFAFEAIHVSAISLPLTDVLTGLETGLINTVATSPIGAIALQWHTRVKYLTDTPLMYLYGTLIVQRKVVESLSPEDQSLVREVMGQVFEKLNRQNRLDNEQAYSALIRQGIQVVRPSPEQAQGWRGVTEEVSGRLVREHVISGTILSTFQSYLDEFRRKGKENP
ncbi:MAG: TRAP transporter substrate-binding protein [Gammaproteobacteria bacterium]